MSPGLFLILAFLLAALAGGIVAARLWRKVRERGLDRWTPTYFRTTAQRPQIDWERDELDVFLAVCDHYEPEWGSPSTADAIARVQRWQHEYPRRFSQFADADGRSPQHTFFFPQDQYRPEYLDRLAELCAALRFHSVADRQNHLQAVVLSLVGFPVGGSDPEFPDH